MLRNDAAFKSLGLSTYRFSGILRPRKLAHGFNETLDFDDELDISIFGTLPHSGHRNPVIPCKGSHPRRDWGVCLKHLRSRSMGDKALFCLLEEMVGHSQTHQAARVILI